MARVLSILRDRHLSLVAKGAGILIALIQYLYKRHHHAKASITKQAQQVRESISKIMQAKFLLEHKDKLSKFKNLVDDNCR